MCTSEIKCNYHFSSLKNTPQENTGLLQVLRFTTRAQLGPRTDVISNLRNQETQGCKLQRFKFRTEAQMGKPRPRTDVIFALPPVPPPKHLWCPEVPSAGGHVSSFTTDCTLHRHTNSLTDWCFDREIK